MNNYFKTYILSLHINNRISPEITKIVNANNDFNYCKFIASDGECIITLQGDAIITLDLCNDLINKDLNKNKKIIVCFEDNFYLLNDINYYDLQIAYENKDFIHKQQFIYLKDWKIKIEEC